MQAIEKLKFLTPALVREIAQEFGTPVFVYSQSELEKRIQEAKQFPNAYGITVRYAMKANSNGNILRIMREKGLHIDASSGYEVHRALHAGFQPEEIMLTSQEMPEDFHALVKMGIYFNACSLLQLERYGQHFPGTKLSIRFNPGLGSGHTKKTDVGGVTSSFGIWHEKIEEVKKIVKEYNLIVEKVHTHIGSGSDPEVWKAVAFYTLEYAEIFPSCEIVNLGGGYKVGRMSDEKSTDLQAIGRPVQKLFEEFFGKHRRKLKLEIEPGTYFVANSGSIIARVMDKVDTGSKGYTFLKLDTGMDSNTRPSLYAARHPLITVPQSERNDRGKQFQEYVVVGHCCESGDVFTQKEGGEPDPRSIEIAEIGDYVVMEGTGAYCASMSAKNYNSFPEAAEVMIDLNGRVHLIRKRQELAEIWKNEIFVL